MTKSPEEELHSAFRRVFFWYNIWDYVLLAVHLLVLWAVATALFVIVVHHFFK